MGKPADRKATGQDAAERFQAMGIVLPEALAKGALREANSLLSVLHWLHEPKDPALEPAPAFVMRPDK